MIRGLAVALLALLPLAPAAAPETLRLLSYNIRNLPDREAPFDVRAPQIHAIAEGFDVVLLQEDFGPDGLHARWSGPVFRGPDARWRWSYLLAPVAWLSGHDVPHDSGLSILIPEWFAARGGSEKIARVAFPDCHGIFRNSHDCWANKGLLGVRVTTGNGASVDVYTTHLDAGGAPGNQAVRAAQLERIRQTIDATSRGRAVILAGDFNTPPRRPQDFAALQAVVEALGLEDAGARHAHPDGAACQVDFVFQRGAADTRLEVLQARELPDTTPGADEAGVNFCGGPWRGLALSDHPALAVTFMVEAVDRVHPPLASKQVRQQRRRAEEGEEAEHVGDRGEED